MPKNLLVVHHTVRNWEDLSKNRNSNTTDFLLYENTTTSADISGRCFKDNGDLDISNVGFVWDNNAPQNFPFLPDGLQTKPFLSSQFQTFFGTDLSNVPHVDLISGSLNHKIHFNDISDCYNNGGTGSIRYDLDNTYWEETGKLRLKQIFHSSDTTKQLFNDTAGTSYDIHNTYFNSDYQIKKSLGSPISPFSVICRDGILYGCGDFHYIIRGHDENFKYKFWQDISSQFTPLALTSGETYGAQSTTGHAIGPIISYGYSKYHMAFIDKNEKLYILSDLTNSHLVRSSNVLNYNKYGDGNLTESAMEVKKFVYVCCAARMGIVISEERDSNGDLSGNKSYLWGYKSVSNRGNDNNDLFISSKYVELSETNFFKNTNGTNNADNAIDTLSAAINSTHFSIIDSSFCVYLNGIIDKDGIETERPNDSLLDLSKCKIDFIGENGKFIYMDDNYLYVLTKNKTLYEIKLDVEIVSGEDINLTDIDKVRTITSIGDVPGEIIDIKRHYNILYILNELGNLMTIDTQNNDLLNLSPLSNTDLNNTKFQSLKGNEGQLFLLTNDVSGNRGRSIYAIGNNLQGKLGISEKKISHVFPSDTSRNIVVAENILQGGFETFPEAPVKTPYRYANYLENFNYLYERIIHPERGKFDNDPSGIRQTPLNNTFLPAQTIGNIIKGEKVGNQVFFNDYTYSDYTYIDGSGVLQINPTFGGEFFIESNFEKCTIECKGPTDVSNVIVIENDLQYSDISGFYINTSDISLNASVVKDLSGLDTSVDINSYPFSNLQYYNIANSIANVDFSNSILGVTVSEVEKTKAELELTARIEAQRQFKLKQSLIDKF